MSLVPVPPYSTDIGEAMQVVAAMIVKHGIHDFSLSLEDDGSWVAGFDQSFAMASTAAEAICLAAVKCVEDKQQ